MRVCARAHVCTGVRERVRAGAGACAREEVQKFVHFGARGGKGDEVRVKVGTRV